jgi:hypothetical protein
MAAMMDSSTADRIRNPVGTIARKPITLLICAYPQAIIRDAPEARADAADRPPAPRDEARTTENPEPPPEAKMAQPTLS